MKNFFLSIFTLVFSLFVNAQVTVDPTFNPSDVGYGDFSGVRNAQTSPIYPGQVYAQAIQSDGKILLGGTNIYGYNGYTVSGSGYPNLLRLNANGTRDTTFNPGTGIGAGTIYAIAIQGDGKIIIGGLFNSYNGITVNGICRITSSGGFDPTFNPGSGVGSTYLNGVFSIIVIPSGKDSSKVLIGGAFNTFNSITVNSIARLTNSGAVDPTFNIGGAGVSTTNSFYSIKSMALQTNGQIIIAGNFNGYNNISRNSIARISSDGVIDASFTSPISSGSATVFALNVRGDGKIWVGGSTINTTTNSNFTGVVLLNTNGSVDASFAPTTGVGSSTVINAILPVSNSKLLIGGSFSSFNGTARAGIALINETGTLDFSFDMGYLSGQIFSIAKTDLGSFIYSGNFNNAQTGGNNSVEKLTSSYIIDKTFNLMTGSNSTVKTFAFQLDKKIIIGGQFNTYNGVSSNRLARITADGEIDTTYKPGTGANSDVNTIVVQADNKIIAAGDFTNFNGTITGRIVRTDALGNIDAAFTTNNGTGTNGTINVIALQADGKILLGGNFTLFNGNAANYIARLNSNGTFDNTFTAGAFAQVRDIAIQADGKLLVGGDFQFFNGSTAGRIVRLNIDGTTDNSFGLTSTGANSIVRNIKLTPDGGILVGGDFEIYNNQMNKRYLIKLTSTGTLDNTFVYSNPTSQQQLGGFVLYNSGKILIHLFGLGSSTTSLQRLNGNGTFDNTLGVYSGNGFVASTSPSILSKIGLMDNGNKILIAGAFTSFNGVGRNRIARLTDATILPLTLESFTANLQNNNAILSWNTSNEINTSNFTVERSLNNTSFTYAGTVASKGSSSNTYLFTDVDLASLNNNTIYYRLKMQDKDGSFTYSPIVSVSLNGSGKTSISLSPNPAKNIAWVQLQSNATEKVQLRITDVSGKQLLLQNQIINSGKTSLPVNVSLLKTGIYYLQVISNNRNETLKLVKE